MKRAPGTRMVVCRGDQTGGQGRLSGSGRGACLNRHLPAVPLPSPIGMGTVDSGEGNVPQGGHRTVDDISTERRVELSRNSGRHYPGMVGKSLTTQALDHVHYTHGRTRDVSVILIECVRY
jgi:hypothetical protein